MAKKRPRLATKTASFDRYVGLLHHMVKSAAWKTMQPEAKALYVDVAERYNGHNNGQISYSVREAAAICLSPATASRMFKILVERGFLRIAQDASFKTKALHLARVWTLTAWPLDDERGEKERATKDFMTWVPKQNLGSTDETARSHVRNRKAGDATKLPSTVSPMKPEEPPNEGARVHQRNTSIQPLPGGRGASGPQREAAQAERSATRRDPIAAEGLVSGQVSSENPIAENGL